MWKEDSKNVHVDPREESKGMLSNIAELSGIDEPESGRWPEKTQSAVFTTD